MCDGGDCRCEVSLQSYLSSSVELGLQNTILGVLVDFSVGERSTNFRGCIIKLQPAQILCESMTGIHSVTSEITF